MILFSFCSITKILLVDEDGILEHNSTQGVTDMGRPDLFKHFPFCILQFSQSFQQYPTFFHITVT